MTLSSIFYIHQRRDSKIKTFLNNEKKVQKLTLILHNYRTHVIRQVTLTKESKISSHIISSQNKPDRMYVLAARY